ncbi:hypothetical protein GCM10010166_66480 [Couchioplanes caeruleus subsp. azureus]|nr:hypothetical protein GCM10010166_66480 [Couchioplanes caeruleus subsp. azureus]
MAHPQVVGGQGELDEGTGKTDHRGEPAELPHRFDLIVLICHDPSIADTTTARSRFPDALFL